MNAALKLAYMPGQISTRISLRFSDLTALSPDLERIFQQHVPGMLEKDATTAFLILLVMAVFPVSAVSPTSITLFYATLQMWKDDESMKSTMCDVGKLVAAVASVYTVSSVDGFLLASFLLQ